MQAQDGVSTDLGTQGTRDARPSSRSSGAPIIHGACLLWLVLASSTAAAQPFVHPGVLHQQSDLDRLRTNVAAGVEPYAVGWDALRRDPHAAAGYPPHPYAIVSRTVDGGVSYEALLNDAIAAHLNAVEFAVTGDVAHARTALEILDAWSAALTEIVEGDRVLGAGLTGYQLAAAAEVLRATYPEWPADARDRFRTLLLEKFYPISHDFLVNHNGSRVDHFFASWDATALVNIISIAVFSDDREKYQEAVDYFMHGGGQGSIMHAVFDGETGQLQESGRSQEYAQLGIGLLATVCEVAWNQGDDLYGYADDRLLRGFEYTASYLLGNDVPFRTYVDGSRTYTEIAPREGTRRPIYEMVWNHYTNRRGVPAPFTQRMAEEIRPEGFRRDHIGFGTALFTRSPEVPVVPADSGSGADGSAHTSDGAGTGDGPPAGSGSGCGYRAMGSEGRGDRRFVLAACGVLLALRSVAGRRRR